MRFRVFISKQAYLHYSMRMDVYVHIHKYKCRYVNFSLIQGRKRSSFFHSGKQFHMNPFSFESFSLLA